MGRRNPFTDWAQFLFVEGSATYTHVC